MTARIFRRANPGPGAGPRPPDLQVARPLDGLPVPVAAWWAGWQLFTAYGGTILTAVQQDGTPGNTSGGWPMTGQLVSVLIAADGAGQPQYIGGLLDQSGHARPVSGARPNAPKLFDLSYVLEGWTPCGLFDPGDPDALTRGDALGLAADPVLCVATKFRISPALGALAVPTLLSLGTAAAPELNIAFIRGGTDILAWCDATLAASISWSMPLGTFDGYHSYVLNKDAAGFDGTNCTLAVDGVDQGVPVSTGGALVLGNELAALGRAIPGVASPFQGTLAGLIVWDVPIVGGDFDTLQAFLDDI